MYHEWYEKKGTCMLSSTSNPKVKQVVNWQNKSKDRRRDGIFLVEGIKMFLEAPLEKIREVYISSVLLEKCNKNTEAKSKEILARLKNTGYEEVSEDIFAKMSDTQTPQGILVVVDRPDYTLEDMLKNTMTDEESKESSIRQSLIERPSVKQPLLVILEDIQDPGNLGTILRTGEGAGVTGVIMSRNTVDIYNPKTIRSTMGSVYRVPFLYVDDLKATLAELQEKNVTLFAAHLKGKKEYDELDFTGPVGFLIGNEGNGLKDETAAMADTYLRIPMEGQVESLNAAIATSLLIYEAHRQRK